MKTKMAVFILCLLAYTAHTAAYSQQVVLKFSGILGQSQPADVKPYPQVGASGLVLDSSGRMWTSNGNVLLGLSKQNGNWSLSDTIELPDYIKLGINWDGAFIYAACYDNRIYKIDPATKSIKPACNYNEAVRAYTVVPSGLDKTSKFLFLEGTKVYTCTADGTPRGALLDLPLPENAAWWYCCLGVEPSTGDILVGSYYPDITIYRYKTNGQQVTTGGWPRKGISVDAIVNIGKTAWALCNNAVSLPNKVTKPSDVKALPSYFSYYNNGLVAEKDGFYYMSTTQGIVEFDTYRQPTHRRIGGISGVHSMAVLSDGTLLGSIENRTRFFRMYISDEPDTALISGGNEPWRVGGNWSSTEAGIVADGRLFVVLDDKEKMLWQYDPERTDGPVWTKLTESGAFNKPVGLAILGSDIVVLDRTKLCEVDRKTQTPKEAYEIPAGLLENPTFISSSNDRLLVADKSDMIALQRNKEGTYNLLWKADNVSANTTSICASMGLVYIMDAGTKTLVVLSADRGDILLKQAVDDIAGGFEPTAIAAAPRWLLIADNSGKRILRYKVTVK